MSMPDAMTSMPYIQVLCCPLLVYNNLTWNSCNGTVKGNDSVVIGNLHNRGTYNRSALQFRFMHKCSKLKLKKCRNLRPYFTHILASQGDILTVFFSG